MNRSFGFLIIGLILAFFVLLLTSSSQSAVPYSFGSRPYYAYEPMEGMEEEEEEFNQMQGMKEMNQMQGMEGMEEEEEQLNQMKEMQGMKEMKEMYREDKNEGFEPIVNYPQSVNYGPFRDSEIIDKFSQVTANGIDGVNGCISSGLSNAGGYICLTPELIDLLKTRGGNASGKCS
jgi:hypothetical protein